MASRASAIPLPLRIARSLRRSAVAAGLIAIAGLAPIACERATPPTPPSASSAAISQTHTLGGGGSANTDHPDVIVRLEADRSRMTVADRLTVTLTIDASDRFTATWTPPAPPSGTLGDFTVAAAATRTLPALTHAPGRGIIEHTLVLEPFLDGAKAIPAITIEARPAGGTGAARSIKTEPLEIAVAPVLPADEAEKAELSPPKPPIATTIRAAGGNPLVAAGAIAALAAWLGAFAWARLVAGRRIAAIDPVAIARRRLADLRARLNATQTDPFGPGAAATTAIAADLGVTIREYLDRHLHIPAAGATAVEIADRLSTSPLPADVARQTVESLAALEQAAFAPAHPRCADLAPHLDAAVRLIEAAAAPAREAAA